MHTFDAEYVLFWTHLILDDGFLSVLKKASCKLNFLCGSLQLQFINK